MKTSQPSPLAPLWLLFLLLPPSACGEDDAASAPEPDTASDIASAGVDSVADAPIATDSAVPLAGDPELRAFVIEDEADLLEGVKAEGMVGDIRIENRHAAYIVEGARITSGYRRQGGWVADIGLKDEDGEPREDVFGDLGWSWDLDVLIPDEVEVLDGGSESGEAHVRVRGHTGIFDFAASVVGQFIPVDSPGFEITVDYRLGPDDEELRTDVAVHNPGEATVDLTLVVGLPHFGDGVWAWSPRWGFETADHLGDWLPYYAAVGREMAYAVVDADDDLFNLFQYQGVTVLQKEAYSVPPGGTHHHTFWYLATDRGPSGVDAARRRLLGDPTPTHHITGVVELPEAAAPETGWVAIRTLEGEVATQGGLDLDGTFELEVEAGEYVVIAHVPRHIASEPVGVDVTSGDAQALVEVPESARVEVSVSEAEDGSVVPARVTFVSSEGTPSPWAPSDVRPTRRNWGGNIGAVAYVLGPGHPVVLPAGTYTVTASRGFSYEIDTRVVTLAAGDNPPLELEIERVVQTTGWVSADFHIHAIRSPDSYVPWEIRALQAVTEDLDLPILTEHVSTGTLAAALGDLGLEDEAIGITGQEVTTFAFGHFNAFPLLWDPSAPNMGAVWAHDKSAPELFEAIRAQSEGDEIIQVNHPTGPAPGNYFGYVGLDALADTVDKPSGWSTNWDTVEVFNGRCAGGSNMEALADWTALTNHGYAKVMASGSDTHNEDRPPGTPRNWIRVEEASLREDPENLVLPVRERRLFVSCGPFVQFEAVDAGGQALAGLGERTDPDGAGIVRFHARVQAPTWMQVDTLNLIENGEILVAVDLAGLADVDNPVVRYDDVLEAEPASDAWYALEVIGSGSMAPVTWSGSPYARTNPIEVDAEADGTWVAPFDQ